MLNFRHSPFVRTVVVPLTLLSFLSACHKWSPVKDPVAATLAAEQPSKVRVTTPDGERTVVHSPALEGDRLVGLVDEYVVRAEIPLDSIREVLVRPSEAGTHYRWVQVERPFAEALAQTDIDSVRVMKLDGTVVEISSPAIDGDAIVGNSTTDHFAVSLQDVRTLERRTADTPATVVLVVVGAGTALLIVAVIAYASDPYCGFANC